MHPGCSCIAETAIAVRFFSDFIANIALNTRISLDRLRKSA